jgi:hypothetical protein
MRYQTEAAYLDRNFIPPHGNIGSTSTLHLSSFRYTWFSLDFGHFHAWIRSKRGFK